MFGTYKPALTFLLVFVGCYFVGNVLYGLYVEFYYPLPDPATVWVTDQTTAILSLFGDNVIDRPGVNEPTMLVVQNMDHRIILRVFEGCNGINVMIVFISFVAAFGGSIKRIMFFMPLGLLVIHASNLLRILLLYFTAVNRPMLFYYFHKYFFTAALYVIVFGLWGIWMKFNGRG